MQILQDYLLYPAKITLQLQPTPIYEMALHTRYDELLTTGDSFANVLKMGSAVLIDMSFVQSFEEPIHPVGKFTEHAALVNALRGWLRDYTTGLDNTSPCEATYLKNCYLAQLINLLTIAHWDSEPQKERAKTAIKHLLELPLQECSPIVHAEVLPKTLANAKETSLQYLLARLFELNLARTGHDALHDAGNAVKARTVAGAGAEAGNGNETETETEADKADSNQALKAVKAAKTEKAEKAESGKASKPGNKAKGETGNVGQRPNHGKSQTPSQTQSQAQEHGDALQKDIIFLSKLANKRTNFTLNQDKLKPSAQGRQDELAVLLPLNTALKFMLSNSILELQVKMRNLADDLGLSVEQLEEQLNVYETTPLPQLLKIFKCLGTQPDFHF